MVLYMVFFVLLLFLFWRHQYQLLVWVFGFLIVLTYLLNSVLSLELFDIKFRVHVLRSYSRSQIQVFLNLTTNEINC